MKKILMTIRLVLVSLLANATHQSSQLSLTAAQNKVFSISFDQSPLSMQSRFFMIDQVEPGYHYLHVVAYPRFHFGPTPVEILYSNYVYIPESSKITASIGRNRALDFISIVPLCNIAIPYYQPINYNNYQVHYDGGHAPMCGNEFTQLKNTIASKAFESSKLQIAEQAIVSNHLFTSQVTELIQLMSFESSRLELAKAAYARTIDRQNYYRVNDSFHFESSIRELNLFIRDNS